MLITTPTKSLKHSLGLCGPFVPSRTPNDAFKYVKLTADKSLVELTAGNGESCIRTSFTEFDCKRVGTIMLPAARFSQILNETTAESIEIAGKKEELIATAGQNEFKLLTIKEADYPTSGMPVTDPAVTIKIPAKVLARALELAAIACDHESSRFAFNSVLMEASNRLVKFVATDSCRLSIVETISCDDDARVLIPNRDIRSIISTASQLADSAEVVIGIFQSQVTFALGRSIICTRQVEGRFPDYMKVMVKKQASPIVVPAGQFRSGVKQAEILRDEGITAITLTFGESNLTFSSGQKGKLGSKIDIPISNPGKKVAINFNPEYLLNWLTKLDPAESVECYLSGSDSPGLFVNGNSSYVLMPLSND